MKFPEIVSSLCPLLADACYASGWRDKLESMLYGVTDAANLSIVLTDGPYGGGVCGATNHTHHVSSTLTFERHSLRLCC
jgi:hypothetical protein|eukprot:COSAG02_NODE_2097_length_9832_cov_7.714579_2_plen_79_part_00